MKHFKPSLSNNTVGRRPAEKTVCKASCWDSTHSNKCTSLRTISSACWDRTCYAKRAEFTKLAAYGTSCYSSSQAPFQESDPFQHSSERSAPGKPVKLHLLEPHADKPFAEVSHTGCCLCCWLGPWVCIEVLDRLHILLEHSNISQTKEDLSYVAFAAGSVFSDKQRETSPSSKCHRKPKKVWLSIAFNLFHSL